MVLVKMKRPLTPVPFLQNTIDELVNAPSEPALMDILDKFDSPHQFERAEERNLVNWYRVLNRFNDLLHRYVTHHDVFAAASSSDHVSHPSAATDAEKSVPPAAADASSSGSSPKAETEEGSEGAKAKSEGKAPRMFTPSPTLVRNILRLTQRLVRNASHDTRSVYNSVELLGALLADEHSAIVLLTLEILNMLMQRSHKLRSTRAHINTEVSERLLELSLGWGGRENRLGLLECCSSKAADSLPADGARLYFEYTKSSTSNPTVQSSPDGEERPEGQPMDGTDASGKKTLLNLRAQLDVGPIPLGKSAPEELAAPTQVPVVTTHGTSTTMVIDNVKDFRGSERWLLSEFASQQHVPKAKMFSLLAAFRRAKRFSEGRDGRLELTIMRLYAITTLYLAQPAPRALNDVLSKEPELLQDLVSLARASSTDGVEDVPRCLRNISIRCLMAMSSDRHRISAIASAMGVNVHHGALPTLLRSEIASLLSTAARSGSGNTSKRPRTDSMTTDWVAGSQSGSHDDSGSHASEPLTLSAEYNRVSPDVQRTHTAEALLALVHSLAAAGGTTGAIPLANSGVLAILVPLLTDEDPHHFRVVAQAIRAMQAIIEGSSQTLGCQLFRDHDGLTLIAKRIASEVGIVDDGDVAEVEQSKADEAAETDALKRRGESRGLYERLGRRQMTPQEALDNPPPSSGVTSRGLLPHTNWAMLRALHQLLLRALGSGGNEVRELVVNTLLPRALRKILAQPFLHGGSLFQCAATVTTEIAHAEPTATAQLVKAGIATTVLHTVKVGLPPCGEAVRCVPTLLAALCLAPSARDTIVNSKPLKMYLLRLATPFYTRALHGESPVMVGSALDELMRHVEALRPDGNEAMIEYLRLSAKFVSADTKTFRRNHRTGVTSAGSAGRSVTYPAKSDRGVPKATNTIANSASGDCEKACSDAILLDKMKLAVANNSCRLAGFAQGSSEHQEGIVQNGGLGHMISLRYAAALALPEASARDGYVFSRHYPTPAMTVVSLVTSLRNFSSRHAAAVLKSLFAVILQDAATILSLARELEDKWLPEEDSEEESTEPGSELGVNGVEDGIEGSAVQAKAGGRVGKEKEDRRKALRKSLCDALKKLRVGVVLLSGLSRGGPGSSAGVWETAQGAHVAAIVAAVERAGRYHLAVVYTGLTLNASSDGDLNAARVTAAADPAMKELQPDLAESLLGDVSKSFGWSWPLEKAPAFKEACKRYVAPPEEHGRVRQNVKGLAWCLVTFVVAAQRLYSTLSKGLTFSSRRLARDPARYAASAKSLAATIGRIFALHLMAAEPLWNKKVITMGDRKVVAAWDYVRGILIEIKGTLFDESRRVTQSLILRSFFDAGGAEALKKATRPFQILQATTSSTRVLPDNSGVINVNDKSDQELEAVLQNKSLSVSSFVLALSDIMDTADRSKLAQTSCAGSQAEGSSVEIEVEQEDVVMSSDSISNQARGISRIMVSEAESGHVNQHTIPNDVAQGDDDLYAILVSESKVDELRRDTMKVRDAAFQYCCDMAIRRIAYDAWNTVCGFLHLLGSCPGLLNSGIPHIPDAAGSSPEWEPRDLQRSSLTVALEMLNEVTDRPDVIVEAFRPDGSAMGDILNIIHMTSQSAEELCQETSKPSSMPEAHGDTEPYLEVGRPEEVVEAPRALSPDPVMLQSLVDMGFPESRAAMALRNTAPGGIEHATEWLISHPEEDRSIGSDEIDGDGHSWGEDGEQNEATEDDAEQNDASEENRNGENARVAPESSRAEDAAPAVLGEDAMTDAATAEDTVNAASRSASSPRSPSPESIGEDGGSDAVRSPERMNQEAGEPKEVHNKHREMTKKMRMDQDGPELLRLSVRTEFGLLAAALEKARVVASVEIPLLCMMAAQHVGPTLAATVTEKPELSDSIEQVAVAPIAIETFWRCKKLFFESLRNVVAGAFRESEYHIYGRHLPYLIVELMSVLNKDEQTRRSPFPISAVCKSMGNSREHRSTVPKSEGNAQLEEEKNSSMWSQTLAIWSHYGGSRARNFLKSENVVHDAYMCLLETVSEWRKDRESPLVDAEATGTIGNLSIREKGQVGSSAAGFDLRPVSKIEAKRLKKVTTALLLIDAILRYNTKDRVIQASKETAKPKEDESPNTDNAETEKAERMETDGGSDERSRRPPDRTASRARGAHESAGAHELAEAGFDEIMEEVFGTIPAKMEVDASPSERSGIDLEFTRKAGTHTKEKIVNAVKESIKKWTGAENSDLIEGMSKAVLLEQSLALLRLWKGLEVGDALLGVLQLLASLTADWTVAEAALAKDIVPLLLCLPQLKAGKSRSTDHQAVRLLTKTILRHLLEDPDTLQEAMESEIRNVMSKYQNRRPAQSVKSLISLTAPMVARDMQCFLSALTSTVCLDGPVGRGDLRLSPHEPRTFIDMKALLEKRPNVKTVISALAAIAFSEFQEDVLDRNLTPSTVSAKRKTEFGLCRFALDLIAEYVELSQIVAVAYMNTEAPPSSGVEGCAFDFVIQKILPPSLLVDVQSSPSLEEVSPEREALCKSARNLFLALCSATSNTQKEAVASLAQAVKMEAGKEEGRPGFLAGLAQCISSATKLRVLRVVLNTEIGNDLARSLRNLDLAVQCNFDVAMHVLKALAVIGQAGTHLARYGAEAPDEISIGNSSRDHWTSLRDREYTTGLSTSYMVL